MKQFIRSKLIPISALTALLFLAGCDSSMNKDSTGSENETKVRVESSENQIEDNIAENSAQAESVTIEADLKSGNFFYIARDVADVQLKAGNYISQLQQSQQSLEQALNSQDHQLLQSTVNSLKSQLMGFNQALDQLSLKSTEINEIRQNIINANAQALKLPLMNGEIDFSQVDFNKIEQQLGSVQGEMLKLAGMLIPPTSSSDHEES